MKRFQDKNDVPFVFHIQLFLGGLMSYLHYLCLFAYSVVQHILCGFKKMYCLRLVSCVSNAARFSGLSIRDCSFGFFYRLFIMPVNLLPYKLRLYSHTPDYLTFLLVSKARKDKPNIFRPCTCIQHARPLHGRIIPVI